MYLFNRYKVNRNKADIVDTEVKLTIREIFKKLREQQPDMGSRVSDRVDVDKMISDYQAIDKSVLEGN